MRESTCKSHNEKMTAKEKPKLVRSRSLKTHSPAPAEPCKGIQQSGGTKSNPRKQAPLH